MERLVVDASVVVKWFLEEEDYRRARDLRNAYLAGRVDLAGPTVLPYEVLNALRFSVMSPERRNAAVDALDKAQIPLHGLEGDFATETLTLAEDLGNAVYDASYAALAKRLECRLVTADEELLEKVEGKVEAFHIRDWTGLSEGETAAP